MRVRQVYRDLALTRAARSHCWQWRNNIIVKFRSQLGANCKIKSLSLSLHTHLCIMSKTNHKPHMYTRDLPYCWKQFPWWMLYDAIQFRVPQSGIVLIASWSLYNRMDFQEIHLTNVAILCINNDIKYVFLTLAVTFWIVTIMFFARPYTFVHICHSDKINKWPGKCAGVRDHTGK